MINRVKQLKNDIEIKEKSINYNKLTSDSTTGDKHYLYPKLKQSLKTAQQ